MRFWGQTLALLLVLVALFELGCRFLLGWSPMSRNDARYGQVMAPGQWVVQSREGFARERTNELGNLDAPMPTSLPRDGILVIGDSLTEARQVSRSERYTERLGAIVGRRVYNVGHSGWSPLNAIAYLDTEKARFRPALTIVQISGNDFDDMVNRKRRLHVVDRNGAYSIEVPSRDERGFSRHLERSAFALLAFDRATAILAGGGNEAEGSSCETLAPLATRALPWMLGELKRAAGNVALLYLPVVDYHHGCRDRCASSRALYVAAAAAGGIPLVDATDAICREFAGTQQPLHGFWNTVPGEGHLNAEGHAVLARLLAEQIGSTP